MNVIIMGPVGSGKSTQAELISQSLGLSLFNAGDLLYFKSKEDTQIGKKIKKIMRAGGLVDDKLVTSLVEEHLKEMDESAGVIIDGFPRSLSQAESFSIPIDKVIYLRVSDSENKKRLLKRGRKDDTPEVIEKRLAIYHEETEPILSFYRQKEILYEVDGERSVEEILKEIIEILGGQNEGDGD